MIPDKYRRSRVEVILARDYLELHAGRPRHCMLECSRSGPLGDAVLAYQP